MARHPYYSFCRVPDGRLLSLSLPPTAISTSRRGSGLWRPSKVSSSLPCHEGNTGPLPAPHTSPPSFHLRPSVFPSRESPSPRLASILPAAYLNPLSFFSLTQPPFSMKGHDILRLLPPLSQRPSTFPAPKTCRAWRSSRQLLPTPALPGLPGHLRPRPRRPPRPGRPHPALPPSGWGPPQPAAQPRRG